jgi:dihydrofolate synthase/folylpolyglutamate synthase
MFTTFRGAVEYLNRFTDYERMAVPAAPRYTLDRMRRLVEALGHPESAFRSLHVAGTKGKGSVAHMAEAILREAGFRTGLYTSPHLVHMQERIRLGGQPVSERGFVWAMNRMEPHLRRLRPTYFETMTAAAFLLFERARVDWAVVEVGLGGRLDATNVIEPAACAVTTIDYDHMDRLGHTLAEIAGEKAGILKPGVPAVTSPQRPAAMRVLRRRAALLRPRFRAAPGRGGVLRLKVEGISGRKYACVLPVLGAHQAANAAVAIGLVEASGARVSPAAVRRALRTLRLPGRIEVKGRQPWMIVDAAHNPVAARALAAALRGIPRRRTILVFGASEDKDWRSMLKTLLPGTDLAVFTRAAHPRAAAPGALARCARGPAVTTEGVAEALELARRLARPSDAVVVTGSFYVAGEALEFLGRER